MNAQRAFLRCQFSAISCKRSLSTFEQNQYPLSVNNKNSFQLCINQNKPFWYCFKHLPPYTLEEDINQNE